MVILQGLENIEHSGFQTVGFATFQNVFGKPVAYPPITSSTTPRELRPAPAKRCIRASVKTGSRDNAGSGPIVGNSEHGSAKVQRFCQRCSSPMEERKPPGDERVRHVCTECALVAYDNPKIVVGCIPVSKDRKRVLLAKRAIPPVGKWTFPAGFLEMDETAERGAAREAWEETRAKLDMQPITLVAVYNILPAKQVQLLYRSILMNEKDIAPGCESQEVRMFAWEDIPWDELAFPTVKWALEFSLEHRDKEVHQPQLRYR